MSSPALAITPKTGFKFVLTVRQGPDAGAVYQLLPPRVAIGRGSDCDVILKDPRVSRSSAVIEFSMEQITIRDVSTRNGLYVNGENVLQASIKDGDIIHIGDTQMAFSVEAIPLPPPTFPSTPRPFTPPFPGVPPAGGPHAASAPPPPTPSYAPSGLSGRQKFYIGLGILVLGLVYLLTSETPKQKEEQTLRTVEQIEQEIQESEQRIEELMQKRVFKNNEEKVRFEEANRHFIEGFRDYQKAQYMRALRSFETAKTIDPKHPLAARYYKLAEKKRDELVAELTLEGRRYREKKMYARCSAQLEKVMSMIPNKQDLKYKAAEALKNECDKLAEQRFVY